MAKFQRFAGWVEEFAITVYWPTCFVSVLDDHNSMFDTLVRMTKALRLRIPGMAQDVDDIDALPLPITLMTQTETVLDQQALMCIFDSPTCDCCSVLDCEQPVQSADSTDVFIKYDSLELSSSFDGITP